MQELNERLDKLTPAVILSACKHWDSFNEVIGNIRKKAMQIKTPNALIKFTAKLNDLI